MINKIFSFKGKSHINLGHCVTINYSDGTTSTVSVTEKDWCTSTTTGQNLVQAMGHRHQGSADQVLNTFVFGYNLIPAAGKTVTGIIVPANANIHLLAITLIP